MPEALTLADIQKARQRVASCVRRTPLAASAALSERLKTNAYVKLELFQKTGSFKVRGVFHKVLGLPPEGRAQGIVTVSGGNHAQAVAYVARALDLKAKILMPEGAPQIQVDAVKGYGGEITFASTAAEAFAKVTELEGQGWTYIHPFDDPLVMSGQGTLGLEILEDAPQVTDVVLSVGGGGLLAGVATAVKSLKPAVRVWGVETEGADCMARSLAEGKVVTLDGITSVARSLGAPAPSERTLMAAQKLSEGITVVPDSEAMEALGFLLERLKILAEPAASCTVAAATRLKQNFSAERHVVLVLSGGNVPAGIVATGLASGASS